MRLLPVLILLTVAVLAVKSFSILFDQNALVIELPQALAAEHGEGEKPDETDPEAQRQAAMEAQRNIDKEREKRATEREEYAKNIDLLLQRREDQGTREFFTDSEIELLQSLKQRRDLLDRRERQIDLQAKLLEAAELQLESKIAKLTALEQIIKQKLGEVNQLEIDRFTSLVKTYETMKSKDAAAILSILDLDIMEKITRSMSTKKLAPILADMDMKAARALTIRLAQPPEELTIDNIRMPNMKADRSELPKLNLE
ncbi:MAG: hypothetical protein HRU29_05415 [Rhizobiales bacterium]|nr:hypothetical protein [Hyphomicrobiales bacterium]NRB13822.1 hypothetical protein [Hyphomicrobiales bacterium]